MDRLFTWVLSVFGCEVDTLLLCKTNSSLVETCCRSEEESAVLGPGDHEGTVEWSNPWSEDVGTESWTCKSVTYEPG